ncbi:hypothetical protein OAI07_01935 [Akkermansiaceae bacterium]|nr:hypothetical protein [Akkermansiaceae bacterium]
MAEEKAPLELKKIVFLTGDDLNHPSGTHEFYAGALLLKKSLENSEIKDQLQIEVVNNWPEDLTVFDDANVIVHYYPGNKHHLFNKNFDTINAWAEKGVGQMFMHYAVDPNENEEAAIASWTGAVYKTGLSINPHWLLKAQLENHSINNGVAPYEIFDEWYCCMDFEKEPELNYAKEGVSEQVYSVMHGTLEEIKQASRGKGQVKKELTAKELTVLWAKERDNGARGVGLTGGHFHKNWANDVFRKQVLNAIVWCSKITVPELGVESPAISEEEINANLATNRKRKVQKISL